MKIQFLASLGLAACLAACSDDEPLVVKNQGPTVPMTVAVDSVLTKSIITGNALDNGSEIGVFVRESGKATYDNQAYNNIKFTASTVDAQQKWTGASSILLSATTGTAYAYYPWVDGSDITALPLSVASQTDLLYASDANKNNAAPQATFALKHAMARLTVDIVRNTYTGTGSITGMTFNAAKASATATLNATTGAITGFDGYSADIADPGFSTTPTMSLPVVGEKKVTRDLLIVPGGAETATAMTFKVTMDGQTYTASTGATVDFAQNTHYKFTLNMNSKDMTVTSVTVADWGTGNGAGETLQPGLVTP